MARMLLLCVWLCSAPSADSVFCELTGADFVEAGLLVTDFQRNTTPELWLALWFAGLVETCEATFNGRASLLLGIRVGCQPDCWPDATGPMDAIAPIEQPLSSTALQALASQVRLVSVALVAVTRGNVLLAVVRCFLRNGNVMGMVLSDTRRRDLYEPRFRTKFIYVSCAAITHPGSQTTYQLVSKIC